MSTTDSETIQVRQNEDNLLEVQYAARVCFDTAEKFNILAWLACGIAALSFFLPSGYTIYLTRGIPFAADIAAAIFSFMAIYYVKWAAKLRGYFDAYVLDISMERFTDATIREIREHVQKILLCNSNEGMVQIVNTGRDDPPGVRNWYEFSKEYYGLQSQFECQKQNTWWNKKMTQRRVIISGIVCFAICLFGLFTKGIILNTFLCSAGIIIKILERLIENFRYIRISYEIDGAMETIEDELTKSGIEKLQIFIDRRRAINVLEFGWIHKKSANKLSKLYEIIAG